MEKLCNDIKNEVENGIKTIRGIIDQARKPVEEKKAESEDKRTDSINAYLRLVKAMREMAAVLTVDAGGHPDQIPLYFKSIADIELYLRDNTNAIDGESWMQHCEYLRDDIATLLTSYSDKKRKKALRSTMDNLDYIEYALVWERDEAKHDAGGV